MHIVRNAILMLRGDDANSTQSHGFAYIHIYIHLYIYIYIYTSVDPIQFLDGVLLVKLPARPGQHVAITIVFRILSRFRFKFIQVRAQLLW